jgi:hypothetical protein
VSEQESAEGFLPTARRAMRMAVEIASNTGSTRDDFDRARLWVEIARELRAGETARPFPRRLDPEPMPLEPLPEASGGLATTEEWSLMREILERAEESERRPERIFEEPDQPVTVGCPYCTAESQNLPAHIADYHGQLNLIPEGHELQTGQRPAPWERGEPATPERVERIVEEALRPSLQRHPAPDETAVLHGVDFDGPTCGNCGRALEWRNDTPDDLAGSNVVAAWVHKLTGQSVCPVSKPDQQHTFAQPLVDRRG